MPSTMSASGIGDKIPGFWEVMVQDSGIITGATEWCRRLMPTEPETRVYVQDRDTGIWGRRGREWPKSVADVDIGHISRSIADTVGALVPDGTHFEVDCHQSQVAMRFEVRVYKNGPPTVIDEMGEAIGL